MRKAEPEVRMTIEHTAEDHRADCQRRLGRHSDKPWEPVAWHPLLPHHIPWMYEERAAEVLGGGVEVVQLLVVEVPVVDMRTDLEPRQSKLLHTALHLPDRHLRLLHRHRSQTDIACRMSLDDSRYMIIEIS